MGLPFAFIRKYLCPRPSNTGVFLLSLFSTLLIALVLWLGLLFLSLTESMERKWKDQLFRYCSPLKVELTKDYFDSWYYQSDLFSQTAGYQPRPLAEKMAQPWLFSASEEEMGDLAADERVQKDLLGELQQICAHHGVMAQPFEVGAAMIDLKTAKGYMTSLSYFQSEPRLSAGEDKSYPLILPTCFRDQGALIGQKIKVQIAHAGISSITEHTLYGKIIDFYDPGLFGAAFKPILAPADLVYLLRTSNVSFGLPLESSTGIFLYPPSTHQLEILQSNLTSAIIEKKLDPYFHIISYSELPFVKDLMIPFQQDQLLMMLVGVIILILGASNIIAFMLLKVEEAKAEIALLMVMGMKKSALITAFTLLGLSIALISLTLSTFSAMITLHYLSPLLDFIASFLNIPFRDAPTTAFLSHKALLLAWITTPLLTILAALFPAIKAIRSSPAILLRSLR